MLPEDHPFIGFGVAQPGLLAVADRPRLQELIHPLALADLRAVRLERAALRAERARDVHEHVGIPRASQEYLLDLVTLEALGQELGKDRVGFRRGKDGVE